MGWTRSCPGARSKQACWMSTSFAQRADSGRGFSGLFRVVVVVVVVGRLTRSSVSVSEKPGASTHPSKGAECTIRPRRGTPDRKSSSGLTSALIFTCFTCEFSTGGGWGCQHFFFPFTPSRTFSLHPSPHSFSSPYSKCVSSERNRPPEITPLSVVFFSPAPVDVKNLPADQPASGLWFPL